MVGDAWGKPGPLSVVALPHECQIEPVTYMAGLVARLLLSRSWLVPAIEPYCSASSSPPAIRAAAESMR
jgi:hypothetical protein